MKANLVFLGAAPASTLLPSAPLCVRRLDISSPIAVGTAIPLEIGHAAKWSRNDVTRVIVGSNPDRADVLLVDEPLTICPEHARFYLNHADPAASHLRPMKDAPVSLNGELLQQFEWAHPKNGDEIQLGAWRFRFEC